MASPEGESSTPAPKRKCIPSGRGKFKMSWKLPEGIGSSSKGDKHAFCKLCKSHISISHGGLNDITRHVSGAVHKQRLQDVAGSTSLMMVLSTQSQSHKVMLAEVLFSKYIAMHNIPFQAADHFSDLVKTMFPDSSIAKDFACKHTKSRSIVCEALDPHYKKLVLSSLTNSLYSLLCDESNDRGATVKLLTILVRAFDHDKGVIKTRHLDTVATAELSASGIFSSIEKVLHQCGLEFSNMVSFVSDTCSVMKGVRNGVIAKIRQKQPKVIDIHCVCHIINLVVKSAVKTLPFKVDELLVDVFFHFHHSTKRVSALHEYAEFCQVEFKAILRHCETRWLSLTQSLKRTLDMWEPLLSYFKSHPDSEKSGKVKSITAALNDPFTKVWFQFLTNVLVTFDKYNVLFQTTKASTVHKVHAESERLLRTVLSFFVKPQVIRLTTDITSISYTDPSIHLPNSDIFVGDDTAALLLHLHENEGESVDRFYVGVKKFYQAVIKKLLEKFDFKSNLFRALRLLDPHECQDLSLDMFSEIGKLLPISFDGAAVRLEFREFVADCNVSSASNSDAIEYWLRVSGMQSPLGDYKYANLGKLALDLLAIPTSNADSERVFSLVRRIQTEFRSRLLPETISAIVGIHLNMNDHCCEGSDFDPSFLQKAKSCTHAKNLKYKNDD